MTSRLPFSLRAFSLRSSPSTALVFALGVAGLLVPVGCERFSSCEDTLSCATGGGGGGTGLGGAASGGSGGTSLGGESSGGSGGTGSAGPCGKECDGETPICDETAKVCVECVAATDCPSALSSKCNADGACEGCAADDDCSHLDGTKVCDTGEKSCVECLDAGDCGGKPCNPLTHECSAFGTDRRTCESCDTDANCNTADNFCVPMKYQSVDRAGGYCLKKTPSCTEPYLSLIADRDSLSGVTGQNYCSINETLATCEAVRALIDGVSCPGGTNEECPESGLCHDIGGTASNRCTYRCSGVDDCKESGIGSTCGDSPNDFCGYVP